ncbi:MAG: ABC transporter ATP-binding protein [Planctomycetes bacterium]|nr:ABC transporter ATP-binding protein [Planctomycetota bacterium]
MSTSAAAAPVLAALDVCYEVGGRAILDHVSLELRRGESVALLGPNGSGKTTLLRTLVGIRRPTSGRILQAGRPLESLTRLEIACEISYLPQNTWTEFDITVQDAVAMGRYPHVGWMRAPSSSDREAVRASMASVGIEPLAKRRLPTLSAGERQRVFIARALAQGSPTLLLDEPTSALDIGHQMELVEILARLHAEGKTILAAVHDLRLAWQHFGRAVLLDGGKITADGPVRDVVSGPAIASAFGVRVRIDDEHRALHFSRAGTEM